MYSIQKEIETIANLGSGEKCTHEMAVYFLRKGVEIAVRFCERYAAVDVGRPTEAYELAEALKKAANEDT